MNIRPVWKRLLTTAKIRNSRKIYPSHGLKGLADPVGAESPLNFFRFFNRLLAERRRCGFTDSVDQSHYSCGNVPELFRSIIVSIGPLHVNAIEQRRKAGKPQNGIGIFRKILPFKVEKADDIEPSFGACQIPYH